MLDQIPVELISNFLSIGILLFLGYKYLIYKKNIDLTKELKAKTDTRKITQEDIEYIRKNEREFQEKLISAETSSKFSTPIFILIGGIIFISVDFSEALIHLNVLVVAIILMQVDKLHKKNLHSFFKELRKMNVKDK